MNHIEAMKLRNMSKRVGIYSGTFDPLHTGHVAFALEALRVCGLDEVVLLPEREPRGKQGVTPFEHRMALIRQVVEEHDCLSVVELDQRQFTVSQTLPELRRLFADAQLTLLLGSDAACGLPHWPDVEMLLRGMSLAIGVRAGDSDAAVRRVVERLRRQHGLVPACTCITSPIATAASSRIRSGEDLSHLHPAAQRYIHQHGLYDWL